MGEFKKWIGTENLYQDAGMLVMKAPEVVVTEKIHGTNVRFGFVDGRRRVGGRNEEFNLETSDANSGMGFLGWLRGRPQLFLVEELATEIGKEVIIYGEWYGNKVQKGVKYLNDGKSFVMFGVRIDGTIADWNTVTMIAERIGVPTVPVLYRGAPDKDVFDRLRILPSTLAKENGVDMAENDTDTEGIVISAIPMECVGHTWAIAKHKHPKFQELASMRGGSGGGQKALLVATDSATAFITEFWTDERLNHVASTIRESGADPRSGAAMPLLIKGMFHDVAEKEGIPEWQALTDDDKKMVGRLHPKKTKELLETYLSKLMNDELKEKSAS